MGSRHPHVPKRPRVRYGVTNHLNLYVPKFKSVDRKSVFIRAIGEDFCVSEIATLPGMEDAGMFHIQAKRYGVGAFERVLAIGRPTA